MQPSSRHTWIGILAAALLLTASAGADVAFTALQEGLWTVYWAPDLETRPKPVGRDLALDGNAPALSPDGSQVAFEAAGQGILICPLHGGGSCRSLEAGLGSSVRPAWDPRSGELVLVRYLADASGEESDILMTRGGLQGVGPLLTQTGNQDDPDVSPDGTRLIYSSAQTVSLHRAGVQVVRHLWVMDLATGAARPLMPGPHQDLQPDWSPDGERIAFASDRDGRLDIWVMRADGSEAHKLTSGPGAKTWPAWSPDGRNLLYTVEHEGRHELWRIGADGTGARRYQPFGPDSETPMRDPDWR